MQIMKAKRRIAGVAVALASVAGLAACTTVGGSSSAAGGPSGGKSAYLAPAKKGPYKVGLANSFAGNTWRSQMVAELKYAVSAKYKSQVSSLTVTDANNDVSTQLSQINDMLSQGVNILLIDAASATALNPAIQRAWSQGVQVVTFDNTTTSPHAINVGEDQTKIGQIGGQWLASKLKKGDSVFTLDGAAGTPVNSQRLQGATAALKSAGINIVGSANTDWDFAKSQSAAANLISAHPNVNGIYSQGGDSSLGAIKALQQRGQKIPPIPGEASNGFLKEWQQLHKSQGFTSIAFSSPPELSVEALDYGIQALEGKNPVQNPSLPIPVITQSNLSQYVRPDLSDSLWVPTMLPESKLKQLYGNK